ncbi:hypothetical protein [Vibrio alfacsensis]|uniref:hypothetical protein n=1 Tax=Vibrio alfacsensis TaxID=1074311 RepID=UPI001C80CE1F|nr:hypothetical protein [Vibrio alfacsensis]
MSEWLGVAKQKLTSLVKDKDFEQFVSIEPDFIVIKMNRETYPYCKIDCWGKCDWSSSEVFA